MKKRKVVILRAGGNELANQLWNYASIYAYALNKGYELTNPSFFEYGEYFTMPAPNYFFKIFFFLPFKKYTKRKTAFRRKIWRKVYFWYTKIIIRTFRNQVVSYTNPENKPFYLAPTRPSVEKLLQTEQDGGGIYFDGWLFRNPIGLEKYREHILKYFKPKDAIANNVSSQMQGLRNKYKHIVGVHIRQGDYTTWRGGTYLISQTRVREILDEYLKGKNVTASETCFVITSDGFVDTSIFNNLNIVVSKENAVHDLFLLSSADAIIGSNSTFGAFASYYGNIPLIVMQKEEMDWDYYTNKNTYFENKYSTFVHY